MLASSVSDPAPDIILGTELNKNIAFFTKKNNCITKKKKYID